MRKKGLSSLYKEALKSSQADIERRSAMEALRQFDNLDLTLGELITDLKKDWKTFSQLPLSDVLAALDTKQPKRRGRKPGRPAGARTRATSRRAPKRLTKAVSARYTESIKAFLAENPDSKTKAIAMEVGLTSKQAASLLKKLRAAKLVSAKGKAAGMRYTLKGAAKAKATKAKATKRPTLRKKSARKGARKPTRKKAPRRKATKK